MPDRETRQRRITGRLGLLGDFMDIIAHLVADCGEERGHLRRFPFDEQLDPAVVPIAHETRAVEPPRQAPGGETEPHALDLTGIINVATIQGHENSTRVIRNKEGRVETGENRSSGNYLSGSEPHK